MVERTLAGLNRFRRLTVRYGRREDIHLAFTTHCLIPLIPGLDGAFLSPEWGGALWVKFSTGSSTKIGSPSSDTAWPSELESPGQTIVVAHTMFVPEMQRGVRVGAPEHAWVRWSPLRSACRIRDHSAVVTSSAAQASMMRKANPLADLRLHSQASSMAKSASKGVSQ